MVQLKSSKPVSVSFRIPYYTQWGQSLVVCGSEPVLGSWNVKRGLQLSPVHQGDELIWFGTLSLPKGFGPCEYSYYVVDDDRNVVRWEMGKKRRLLLPQTFEGGELLHLHDFWQVLSSSLFESSFFSFLFHNTLDFRLVPMHFLSKVPSRTSSFVESALWRSRNLLGSSKIHCRMMVFLLLFNFHSASNVLSYLIPVMSFFTDSLLVHFKVCCPNLQEGTPVNPSFHLFLFI